MLRDQESLEIAGTHFDATSVLCPDMAFWLGDIDRSIKPTIDVLWLGRTDVESTSGGLPSPDGTVVATDWLSESPGRSWSLPTHLRVRAVHYAIRLPRFAPGVISPPHTALSAGYDFLSRERLMRGVRLLSSARVIVTDRLHGHILCQLLHIPHVLLDNSYGKIKSFWNSWTEESPFVYWADSQEEALEMALELARSITEND